MQNVTYISDKIFIYRIDFMNKQYQIFSDEPTRHDSMMFSSSTIAAAQKE